MVLTNVYGAALTIRATLDALKESKGHMLLTGSVAGRRARRRLALLRDQVGDHRHGRVAAPGAQRQRRAGDGDRAGDDRHAVLRDPLELEPLQADDIARAVMFAVQQPPHMDVNEILIRPTAQPG